MGLINYKAIGIKYYLNILLLCVTLYPSLRYYFIFSTLIFFNPISFTLEDYVVLVFGRFQSYYKEHIFISIVLLFKMFYFPSTILRRVCVFAKITYCFCHVRPCLSVFTHVSAQYLLEGFT